MSFVPQSCVDENGECCSVTFTGFCLEDGTPIGIVIQDEEQTGWFELTSGVFTAGPPPEGTQICPDPPRTGDWAVNDAPIAGVAATASKAAVVGATHVATAISFSVLAESATAPTATNLTITLRDGSSGAGTVLMVWRVHVAADMLSENIAQVVLGGLNVIGSENTAMTLEFDVGVINILEDVSLTGYTVT